MYVCKCVYVLGDGVVVHTVAVNLGINQHEDEACVSCFVHMGQDDNFKIYSWDWKSFKDVILIKVIP